MISKIAIFLVALVFMLIGFVLFVAYQLFKIGHEYNEIFIEWLLEAE